MKTEIKINSYLTVMIQLNVQDICMVLFPYEHVGAVNQLIRNMVLCRATESSPFIFVLLGNSRPPIPQHVRKQRNIKCNISQDKSIDNLSFLFFVCCMSSVL